MVCKFDMFEKTLWPRVGGVAGLTMILVKLEQLLKASSPMLVTELPMMSELVKPEQSEKA